MRRAERLDRVGGLRKGEVTRVRPAAEGEPPDVGHPPAGRVSAAGTEPERGRHRPGQPAPVDLVHDQLVPGQRDRPAAVGRDPDEAPVGVLDHFER